MAIGVVLLFRLFNLVGTDVARATANANALQSVERTLGLDVEVAANHWLARSPALSAVAVWCYRLYYVRLAGVLLWLLARNADAHIARLEPPCSSWRRWHC